VELNDFQCDRNVVDNEIFYLEREIFDYNQQYKTLLTQQSMDEYNSGASNETAQLNANLRQIAHMLEEKSEKLFQLKKQQQQSLIKESM